MSKAFNFNEAAKELLARKKISGKRVLAPLVKQSVEAVLEAKMESHIADKVLKGEC